VNALAKQQPGGQKWKQIVQVIDLGGRVPPHDLGAEAAVLASMLADGRKVDLVADALKPEHFYSDANRRVYEAALAVRARRAPVDLNTVAAWLKDREWLEAIGGVSYLAKLIDSTPAVAHVEEYARIIVSKAQVRTLIETCQLAAAEGFGDIGDPDEWLSSVESRVHTATRVVRDEDAVEMRDLVAAEERRLDAIERGELKPEGVPFGFAELDRVTGGMRPKEVTVIAGRPGMGKTSLATDIARRVAATPIDGVQQGVLFISIEMPRESLTRKMAAQRALVNVKKIIKGELSDHERDLVRAAHLHLQALPIIVDDNPVVSPMRLRARIRRLQSKFDRPGVRKLVLVVVDYIQRVRPDEKCQTREQEVARVATGFAEIAKDTGVHMIELAQLNRLVEQRAAKDALPKLSDLRESGQIEQDAHNIIFVHRAEYYLPKDAIPADVRGKATLLLAKQREGEAGCEVTLGFRGFCTGFHDV